MMRLIIVLCTISFFLFTCNMNDNLVQNDPSDDTIIQVDYSVEDTAELEKLKAVDYNSDGNLANLTALRCDAPLFAEVGDTIDVYVEAENNGTITSITTCYVYMSDNNIISTNDIYLGYVSLGSLVNGQFGSGSKSFTVPSATILGRYFIGFIIDRDNSVKETKEYDNILDSSLLPTITVGKPNIYVSSITAPASTSVDYYLSFTITNSGNIMAGPFNIRLYYSSTYTTSYLINLIDFTGNYEYYSNIYTYGIAPGQTVSITYYCDVDYSLTSSGSTSSLNPGTYPLVIRLDPTNLLNESNELDNIFASEIIIE